MEKIISILIEKIKVLIDKFEKRDEMYAKILQKKQEAKLPESEVSKITEAVREAVRQTPCATPNVEGSAQIIADKVVEKVESTVQTAVENKIKSTHVKLEHHHTFDTTWGFSHYAEKRTRYGFRVLLVLCVVLIISIVGGVSWYHNREAYWGKQYWQICQSKYITDSERKALLENYYTTGILPLEYHKAPTLVKEKIRRNQEILRHRKMDAENNGGKCSAKTPIEL